MNGLRKKIRRGERGSIMALSAVAMLSILLAAGLGVDISRFYLAKNELQNAADAAALAAASALNSSSSGISGAKARALQEMNKYNFNNANVVIQEVDVRFGVNLEPEGSYVDYTTAYNTPGNIRFVKVTTPQLAIPVSFAAMVLGNSRNLSATATAGLSVPLNTFCNFIPLSVIDYDVPMVPGQTYTIRADTGGAPSPGNYQILAVAGPGGVDVGFGIGAGVDACASPGETYNVDTKPGLTAGKVRTGLNARFDDYGGSQLDPVNEPPDTNVKEGITHDQYLDARDPNPLNTDYHSPTIYNAASHPGVDDRRIVLIPIVKLAQYDAGRGTVTFDRFGAFFLKTKASGGNGGELEAEFIDNRFAVGKGRYIPGGAVGNPLLATPVLYK
jgi:Flp pilus assembly protein TadG